MPEPTEGLKVAEIFTDAAGIAVSRPPIGCGKCDSRWGGANTAHCSGCHTTFTGIAAFDKHRSGSHAAGTRHCLSPEDAGLVRNSRSYECYGLPGDNPWDREGEAHA